MSAETETGYTQVRHAMRIPPLFLTSIPKSGTHLVVPVLESVLDVTGHVLGKRAVRAGIVPAAFARHAFVYGHVRCRVRTVTPPGLRILVLIRDPRDIILSMRDYLARSRNPRHWGVRRLLAGLPREEQLMRLVDGVSAWGFAVAPIERHCGHMLEWRKRGGVVLRYEDLMGPEGPELLAKAIGRTDLRVRIADTLAARRNARGGTFNVGGTRWRREMPQAVRDHIRARGDIVARLGYEP